MSRCSKCGAVFIKREDPRRFGYSLMCMCGESYYETTSAVQDYDSPSQRLAKYYYPGDTISVEKIEAEDLCTKTERKAIRETYKDKRIEQKEKGLMPSEKATAVVNLIVNQTGGSASGEQTKQLATVVDTLLDMKHSSGMKFPPDITLDGIIKVLVTAVLTGFVLRHFPDLKDQLFPRKDEEKTDAAVCTQPVSGAA